MYIGILPRHNIPNLEVFTIRHKHFWYYQNSCHYLIKRLCASWSVCRSRGRRSHFSQDQMIFFGANDACLPRSQSSQHVPLERYKDNLQSIIQHPLVQIQHPRLILVTPPPVNEYAIGESDSAKGILWKRRTAEHTKLYADACREVGQSLGVLVLDMWSRIMSGTADFRAAISWSNWNPELCYIP